MPFFAHLLFRCPVCLNRDYRELDESTRQCTRCMLGLQTTPADNPGGIYTRESYDNRRTTQWQQNTAWARFNHDVAVGFARLEQMQAVLPKTAKEPYWTDFGCNNGGMLAAARMAGCKTRGVELDQQFCDELRSLLGLDVVTTANFLAAPYGYKTDVLSLFDVLEHLLDPVGVLGRAAQCLVPGGVLVIEVPDLGQHEGPFKDWHHRRLDEHLTHWSQVSLNTLRERYFPHFEVVHDAVPIVGKRQVVWKRRP